MRTSTHRYTTWVAFNYTTSTPIWNYVYGKELYDHSASPVPTDWAMEHVNLAAAPKQAQLVKQLHEQVVKCGPRPDACYRDAGLVGKKY
jgi:hypothetical protein